MTDLASRLGTFRALGQILSALDEDFILTIGGLFLPELMGYLLELLSIPTVVYGSADQRDTIDKNLKYEVLSLVDFLLENKQTLRKYAVGLADIVPNLLEEV